MCGTCSLTEPRRVRPTRWEVSFIGEAASMFDFSRVKFRPNWSKHGQGT